MSYIGENVKRIDGVRKVTGEALFVGDLNIKAYCVKVVRSACAHGIIKSIDLKKAGEVPGVVKIVTGKDAAVRIGFCLTDQTPLAVDRVRYFGEPVACVVACDEETAKRAARMVSVEYEELEPLIDIEQAYHERNNLIHPNLDSYEHVSGFNPAAGTNVFHSFRINRGDLEKAWAESDFIIENRYTVPMVQHVALEPHGALGIYYPGQEAVMYASSQAPFLVRKCLSKLLGLPVGKIQVKVPYLGGGFGGKSDVTIEPLLGVVLSSVPGKWCRLILDRDEVFVGTVIGRGCVAYYKTGIKKDGTILAEEIKLFWNGGGYGDYAVNIVVGGGVAATGPYQVPNLKIESYGVYTNTPPVGACRGYGHPEVHWACERQMDIIAEKLGIAPVEIRLKNCLGPGKKNAIGQEIKISNGDISGCIKKAAQLIGLDTPLCPTPGKSVGRGLAAFGKFPVMTNNAQSGAIIRVNEDGGVTLTVGAIEMGQGLHTTMTQILASALQLPLEKINVITMVDTDSSPYEWQTVASHSTWAVGNAVLKAADDLVLKLKAAASSIFKVNIADVSYAQGLLHIGDKKVKIAEVALGYVDETGQALNAPFFGVGTFAPSGLGYLDPQTGQGNLAADWTFGCQAAEIEIVHDTGEIRINKLVTVIDAGRIINKQNAAEQIKGAMVQALGAAVSERLIFSDKGILRNNDLTDYKILTASDIPADLQVHFIETPEETGPYGARGLGEHGAVAVAPAVANALYNAIKLNMFDLLLNKDYILEYLAQAQRGIGR